MCALGCRPAAESKGPVMFSLLNYVNLSPIRGKTLFAVLQIHATSYVLCCMWSYVFVAFYIALKDETERESNVEVFYVRILLPL